MPLAMHASASCHSTAVVAISISISAVLLYYPGDPSCSEQTGVPTGFGDCVSLDLDSSSGNGDVVSLLQSVKMPVACTGARCKTSGTSQMPIADIHAAKAEVKDVSRQNAGIARLTHDLEQHKKEAADTREAVPSKSEVKKIAGLNEGISRSTHESEKQLSGATQAGSLDTSTGPHGKIEKKALDIDLRSRAAAKHFSGSTRAESLGLGLPVVLIVVIVAIVAILARACVYRPTPTPRLASGRSEGALNRSSEISQSRLQPPRKSHLVTQSVEEWVRARPTQPRRATTEPHIQRSMQQSPETPYERSSAQNLRSLVQGQSANIVASKQPAILGSGGKYILPLEDVVAMSYDDDWHFNVEDASSNAIIPVEIKLTAESKKCLEISEFYQVGASRVFATARTSPDSAAIVQVALNGARAASIQGNDTGGFVIMQQGHINFIVDIAKRETAPWITIRHSNGIAATMDISTGPMFGQKMEVLKLLVKRDYNAKLLLACVLGISAFFDWPKPPRGS